MIRHDGDERRRYPRSRRGFSILMDDAGPGVMNHIVNISGNGILCHTIRAIPLMTKMGIVLELPNPENRRVECEGVVIRCEPHECGDDNFKVAILFTRIADEDHRAIVRYVDHDLAQAAEE